MGRSRRTSYESYDTCRFSVVTDSVAEPRSKVAGEMFLAMTRTVLLDHTWQSSTKAMLLLSSDASAKSPRRAPGTRGRPSTIDLRPVDPLAGVDAAAS